MSLTKATYSMISGATYNVLDYGADSSGATDSTPAFQLAVDAAETAGGGAIYVPSGTFLLNGKVDIGGSNIRVYGNGASSVLLKASTFTHLAALYLTGGTQNNLEFDHIKFSSTLVRPAEYSFGFIDGELGTGDFDNIIIHDNIFTCPDDNRIAIVFASSPGAFTDRLVIRDNVFDDILGAAIAILNQNSDTVVRNFDVKITGNTFNSCAYFCMTISGPTLAVVISENTFTGTCGYGIELVAGVQGCVIEANVFSATFTQDLLATSGPSPYPSNTQILVKNNVTPLQISATWTLQSCSFIFFEGNSFNTTGSMIFSGVNLGMAAWLVNNRITAGYQSINGASVLAFNNYIGNFVPYENGFSKDVQLSGGGTTSTIVINTVGESSWTPYAVRATCVQVEGSGTAGGVAESIIAFRYLTGSSAVQTQKTDLATSANIALTTSYAEKQLTITATSGTANVRQIWKIEFLSPGLLNIS